jgi:hypothetical protein
MATDDRYYAFRGNSNLKKTGVPIQWTQELMIEYMKCMEDPIYFVETYMRIISVDDGLVPFKLYDFQKDILTAYKDNRSVIVTTARQVGKSTTTCGFILWYILFHAEKTVAILANKADTAREILGRVELAYQHLPPWLQHGVKEWNKGSFILENDSRVFAAATSSDSIRGFSINFLFIDECAHIEGWEDFSTSTLPVISSGKTTKIALVSTPCGLNHFYGIWQKANDRLPGHATGKNQFFPIEVKWDRVPGRDLVWKEKVLADMNFNHDKFGQEYDCEFLGSSGTLISGAALKKLRDISENVTPVQTDGNLKIYENPIKGHIYACVADVSRGKGLDYSAASVIDITAMPFKQVCVYRDNMITPLDYASKLFHMCKSYNNAHILVEINDIGGQVVDSLWYDFEYEYILHTMNAGRAGKKISEGFADKTERGIKTSLPLKNLGCILLKLLVEQDKLEIYDKDTVWELSRFSKKNPDSNKPGGYEAEEGATDDLVMSLVLFAWYSDQQHMKDLNNLNTLQELRDTTDEQMAEELAPFGFVTDGTEEIEEEAISYTSWVFHDEWQ